VSALTIRIKKHGDGRVALSCTRADGTVTWQRQEGAQAAFFPRHDLTHFAVESVLGHRRGFYGLVAEGWNLTDFGTPWPRGPLPPDLDPSELIVGFLDLERAAGVEWTAEDFTEKAAAYYADHGLAGPPPTLTEAQLQAIRARARGLFMDWAAIAPGSTLELVFDVGDAPDTSTAR
jgi:hypothetical protein